MPFTEVTETWKALVTLFVKTEIEGGKVISDSLKKFREPVQVYVKGVDPTKP